MSPEVMASVAPHGAPQTVTAESSGTNHETSAVTLLIQPRLRVIAVIQHAIATVYPPASTEIQGRDSRANTMKEQIFSIMKNIANYAWQVNLIDGGKAIFATIRDNIAFFAHQENFILGPTAIRGGWLAIRENTVFGGKQSNVIKIRSSDQMVDATPKDEYTVPEVDTDITKG
ncbi:hypothetical protein CC78DRAFT_289348 [Lojkania enalia]|uniref:Uncharacterized protein n=1 Tax=Lojkania enalia TaxID=147567 RepID=A0A9P4K7K1_9PLEO|nr:hypothetical protein CC78DRAFT_289348 [Didymosphaeria enalia]